jgi:pyruvate,water dikinase
MFSGLFDVICFNDCTTYKTIAMNLSQDPYILPLNKVGINDIDKVGGKNASLGEMLQNLSALGINIPNGFVITVAAYRKFLDENKLRTTIRDIIDKIDYDNIESLRRGGLQVRQLLKNSRFPKELSELIIEAYFQLSKTYDQDVTDVAVRSSATAEDLPDASFAGQQETYLNVRGPAQLIDSVRNCFASLFTDRAISYRKSFGYDDFNIGLSVCIQKMVRSDLGASGVAFSIDTESGFKDAVVINSSFGLGEMIVQGSVSPDEYIVFKPTLKEGFAALIEKKMGVKDKMMVYGDDTDERVKVIYTEKGFRDRFSIKDETALKLASWVMKIEDYYTRIKGKWTPMDVEWAVDGLTKDLFIVQARPETIHSQKNHNVITEYRIDDAQRGDKVIVKGIAVGDKIASGKVNILFSLDKRVIEGHEFKAGDVLVTDMTDPDWEPIMKKASAIITNKGGRTCHAAIVARELGVPAIVGCGNATDLLSDGQEVTASCAEGEGGLVYKGAIGFVKEQYNLDGLPEISTPLMLNVASPSMSFQFSHLPNKGVGLAREEFIINNYIQVHPMALLKHHTLNDPELSNSIAKKIVGFANEEDFFIRKLSYGIAKIASSFYPNKVIVRFSDFKSNEYFNLLGGKYFEPTEENPMIGWRGASRYYSDEYKVAFGMECKAIKKVREEMGLMNVVVMIPFCRTVEELIKVQEVMEEYGLVRGENGLEIYLMAELPSNIMMAEEFAPLIDGFSIGSNDLTQLTLGLDRDSSLVAHIYDERNPAVKRLISMLIDVAKKHKVKVGICGQGPSDFPDFAQFLVEKGIDSISVTPDSIIKTIKAIAEVEGRLKVLAN